MQADKEALEHLESRALAASEEDRTHVPVRIVPENMKVESLEQYLQGRCSYRGTYTTQSITDFAKYASGFPGGDCFINQEKMSATEFFDLGDIDNPGHGRNRAVIALEKTAPFSALLAFAGNRHSQKDTAEWAEDWSEYLVAFTGDGDPMEIKRAIAAIRRVTISAKKDATHDQGSFKGSRSSMEEIEAKSDHELPAGFRFCCEPYHGLQERSFELRLSVITSDPPALVLRHVRMEESTEAMAREFSEKLQAGLKSAGADANVFIGTFSP